MYCVPNRTIMDNLFLLRDIVNISKMNKNNLGILSIDQEKAFVRVDQPYLFKTLTFMCGETFLSWIRLQYYEACVMVKVTRGSGQGCPLSGQLYVIAIEPLLCKIVAKKPT